MKKTFFHLLLPSAVLGLALSAASCTYLRETIGLGPQRPRVQVSEVQITKISLAALELLVSLRVDNPNSFALDFSKLRYQMMADGQKIASGQFNEKLSVAAESRAIVKLPVTVEPQAALQLAKNLLTKNIDTEAVLTATAIFESPFGDMDVTFEDKRPLKKLAGL